MFIALQQLLPGHLSPWILLLIVISVVALDALIVLAAIVLVAVVGVFKAVKMLYDTADRLVDRLVYAIFCLIEDVLESPPFDKIPFFQLVLLGIKKAYDLVNSAQKLVEFAVNLAITVFAAVFLLALVLGMAVINIAAIGVIIHYLP